MDLLANLLKCVFILFLLLSVIHKSKQQGASCEKPAKVQVVFLLDASLPKGSKWPIIQTEMTKEVASLIQHTQTSVEFGLMTYQDWKNDDGARDECYTLVHPLTSNSAPVLDKMSTIPGGADEDDFFASECSLTMALLIGAADEKMGWDKDDTTKKFIIVYTLKPSVTQPTDKIDRRDSTGDGFDTCQNSNPPSAEVLRKVVEENNVYVLLQVFFPDGREEVMGRFYSPAVNSPFHMFSEDVTCAQYYGRLNSTTARSTYWGTIPEGFKFAKRIGPGFREEDIEPEDMKLRAGFLFRNCFVKALGNCTKVTAETLSSTLVYTPSDMGSAKILPPPKMQQKTDCTRIEKGLQVVFMVDASLPKGSKWPTIQQEMSREVATILKQQRSPTEFALVAYYTWKASSQCFSILHPFTTDPAEMLEKIESLPGEKSDDLKNSMCSVTIALFMTLTDVNLAWSNDRQKIIILFPVRLPRTDMKTAYGAGDQSTIVMDDRIPNCNNSKLPSAELLEKAVTNSNVYVILATFLPAEMEESVGQAYSANESSAFHLLSSDIACAQYFSTRNSITAFPKMWEAQRQPSRVTFKLSVGSGFMEGDINPEDLKRRADFLILNCIKKKFDACGLASKMAASAVTLREISVNIPNLPPFRVPLASQAHPKRAAKIPFTIRTTAKGDVCSLNDNELPKLQVLFLVDASIKRGSDWATISHEMTKKLSSLINMKALPSVEFALAAYYNAAESNCYTLLQPFTNDLNTMLIKMEELELTGGNVNISAEECSLTMAILLATKDNQLAWNNDLITVNTMATRKFIVAYPIRVSNTKSSFGKRDSIGDGSDTCENSNSPSAQVLRRVVYENDIVVMLGTYLLEGKEEQIGKFYSSDKTSPFHLFTEETICSMYFSVENSVKAPETFWKSDQKSTSGTNDFSFTTEIGKGFKESDIRPDDIQARAHVFFKKCFIPELTACDWEDPPAYNTLGL